VLASTTDTTTDTDTDGDTDTDVTPCGLAIAVCTAVRSGTFDARGRSVPTIGPGPSNPAADPDS
jgi:hypothetical protein